MGGRVSYFERNSPPISPPGLRPDVDAEPVPRARARLAVGGGGLHFLWGEMPARGDPAQPLAAKAKPP